MKIATTIICLTFYGLVILGVIAHSDEGKNVFKVSHLITLHHMNNKTYALSILFSKSISATREYFRKSRGTFLTFSTSQYAASISY